MPAGIFPCCCLEKLKGAGRGWRHLFVAVIGLLLLASGASVPWLLTVPAAGDGDSADSLLRLTARYRVPHPAGWEAEVREKVLLWKPEETAIIICDMWDRHWCNPATERVAEMARRMNRVVAEARKRGVLIVHAPSDTMDFYRDTPQRRLAMEAPPAANAPPEIDKWCDSLEGEPPLPVDASDGGCDADPAPGPYRAWSRQIETIEIAAGDAVSDSGREIWNFLEQRGIQNVILMGVHTNMCVIGRPFGLRRMVRSGKNVVLARDLTDSMYNPARPPYVSHQRGTELVIRHVETHLAPSIHSQEITGEPQAPHVVFVIGEDEYETEVTLPGFAREELEPRGVECTFVFEDPSRPGRFPDLEEALQEADLMVLSVRRRALSVRQLELVREYLDSGRPLVAIRTSSHAFALRDTLPEGSAEWPTFDVDILGARYEGHYSNRGPGAPKTMIWPVPEAAGHPILAGIPQEKLLVVSHLYQNSDLAESVQVLLMGEVEGQEGTTQPVAWTNTYKSGRIFYTSLGALEEFELPTFRHLLLNATFWALEKEVPDAPPPDVRGGRPEEGAFASQMEELARACRSLVNFWDS